jgi:hypothetical protein
MYERQNQLVEGQKSEGKTNNLFEIALTLIKKDKCPLTVHVRKRWYHHTQACTSPISSRVNVSVHIGQYRVAARDYQIGKVDIICDIENRQSLQSEAL